MLVTLDVLLVLDQALIALNAKYQEYQHLIVIVHLILMKILPIFNAQHVNHSAILVLEQVLIAVHVNQLPPPHHRVFALLHNTKIR